VGSQIQLRRSPRVKCDRCGGDAVIDQPYRGGHLCGTHFRASIEERARREMHRQLPRFGGGTVAVALSGGKDSAVALALSHRYFGRRPTVRLVAISVDEGIRGYRSPAIAHAASLAEQLGIDHRVVRARTSLGVTTDLAARHVGTVAPCSFCGVWRRKLLNATAREERADVLVLGFNLDDLAQTVLMNLARADLSHLVRMAPHRTRQPGLVPRVAPLAMIPEREVFLYARLRGLPFDHGECPHAMHAARNVYREVVWKLEDAQPGTRQALLRTRDRLVGLLEAEGGAGVAGRCQRCGEPSAGTTCRSCEYLSQVRSSVMPTIGS
jgi:uncharacterized protein (TIGR00269 family)